MNIAKTANLVAALPERRPMFTREWNIFKRLANWLAHQEVSPNAISLAGMAASVGAGAALALTGRGDWVRTGFLLAVVGIVLRGMANLLDGMVAVQRGIASPVGELFNEVPDRVSDVAILVGAGYALNSSPVLGFAAALAALLTAYVRAQGKAIGTPHEFCGPMAKPQRMGVIALVALFCGLVPNQFDVALFDTRLGPMAAGLLLITIGSVYTAGRRLHRIASRAARSYTAAP
jgi:phosphatidylglycerophosphate synthase